MSQAKGGKPANSKEMEIEKAKLKVPENYKKRQERDNKLVEGRKLRRTTAVKTAAEKRKLYLEKGQKYAQEYAAAAKKLIDEKRKARKEGGFYVPDEAKVAIVVRIRGINCLNPTVRKILQLFRLR
jgi:large subunit ribosomal protein L7e